MMGASFRKNDGVKSSIIPAPSSVRSTHVEMMGLIGMGNNPMVGATVACAVAVEEASNIKDF